MYRLDVSKCIDNCYVVSDTHFGHAKCATSFRKFPSLEEYENLIIENWNSVVPKDGIVFHLGDFEYKSKHSTGKYFNQLNGKIHLILGNHDNHPHLRKQKIPFASITPYLELISKKDLICLSHYPMYIWNSKHHGSFHLHGHCHYGAVLNNMRIMNMSVDLHNFSPVKLTNIIQTLREYPFGLDECELNPQPMIPAS